MANLFPPSSLAGSMRGALRAGLVVARVGVSGVCLALPGLFVGAAFAQDTSTSAHAGQPAPALFRAAPARRGLSVVAQGDAQNDGRGDRQDDRQGDRQRAPDERLDLRVGGRMTFYGDNTELSNPFREGETLIGTFASLFLEARLSERLALRGGIFGHQRFGDVGARDRGLNQVRPVLALIVGSPRSRLVLGTLETGTLHTSVRHTGRLSTPNTLSAPQTSTPQASTPQPGAGHTDAGQTGARPGHAATPHQAGPDRAGPHGLLPPLQRDTLAFERPYEAGLQWILNTPRLRQDAWLNWQRINTRTQREVFDAGLTSRLALRDALALRGDLHVVHQGGQLSAAGPVADSVATALGVEAGGPIAPIDRLSLEGFALVSRDVPDRERAGAARTGFGTFVRAALEEGGWRAHVILWRGTDFVKVEGDPLYQSLRRDGTRYRGLRDYAEAGLTRTFPLASRSWFEASARWHRVESDYEYSFRLLAIAAFDKRLAR